MSDYIYILTTSDIRTLTEDTALEMLRRGSYGEAATAAKLADLVPEDMPEDWAASIRTLRAYRVNTVRESAKEVARLVYDAGTEWEDGQDYQSLADDLRAELRAVEG